MNVRMSFERERIWDGNKSISDDGIVFLEEQACLAIFGWGEVASRRSGRLETEMYTPLS